MAVVTLGCRLNIAESDAIAAMLGARDDLVVVNSCAVTAEALAQTRKAIRKAARERPDARIVVTGCAASTEPETFRAMAEVADVVANHRKMEAQAYPSPFALSDVEGREARGPFGARPSTALRTSGDVVAQAHTRAFIEVQNGCDHACTFCIIPLGRGPSRSIAPHDVIARIAAATDAGAREVVLTGVDVTAYGADLPGTPTLGHLVERILRDVPALPRLRLSSLDAVELDDRLIDLVTGEARLMPHLHLSLQAGDDMILKRMKRRHSRAQAVELVARLKARRPDIAIGADLIAGFPTETDAMAANTLALLDDCDVVHAHIFPYSPRATTPAARMPQLTREIILARARALREKATARRDAWLAGLVGGTQRVLVERGGTSGHAGNFARVTLDRPAPPGTIVDTRIHTTQDDTLIGTPA
ncbi:tRNA (N(6)-L-threonylcarbamoyladenosine(37)-C(2))-methylthiotransferase MtaB [Sphingomonas naphthae]|uniref:tRNA (N(6)-L-threonylcarbamoyladenosine(37)-C(2))-methylthiotransferase MtaB n=1 Tax=Sphingomonas naphthae TaxID=1813468 RepID=A0ABY7TMS2_9SPHN|nr:tRNA (N(6)-L-threonylcarbamoyladenosine(37)-C(2))-methylthiotransferase MtaB [Sphingomonas naphthae]WCT74323.1 tRNA (N(6)-L-threonylcarbamoyladenosine(37)-C(2))-methylthiotransferase MtaB [Sphingomonas naphthae]